MLKHSTFDNLQNVIYNAKMKFAEKIDNYIMTEKSEYTLTINQIESISNCFLTKIASDVNGKDVYFRNCIAKTVSFLKTIDLLFCVEKYNEGWILYRSLIDRLVYLYYIIDNNNFIEFDEWTFVKLYEFRHNAKVDGRFKRLLLNPKFKTPKGDTNTYKEYKGRLNWVKPNPLDILKSKDLDFIYKFGYNYASMHTHPMAWDGSKEFHNLTGLEPNPNDINKDNLLIKNSLLISSMIFNLIITNIQVEMPRFYLEFMSEFRKFAFGLENNFSSKYQETFELFKKEAGY